MKTHISTIQRWSEGRYIAKYSDAEISELCIDSRKVAHPEAALFFAITTAHRDGHNYLQQAYNKGIRNFVVSQPTPENSLPDSNIILVENAVNALQLIGSNYRDLFPITCIGITGSNGKTVVKEWLHQLLADDFNITRSPKSYNSQIGVPLSVSLINEHTQVGIFEAGISQPDEMVRLEKIIQPSIGIFTNIGDAHSEGFESIENKISEKLQLFKNSQQLITCKDHNKIQELIATELPDINLFTWSFKEQEADLFITEKVIDQEKGITSLTALHKGHSISIQIPFTDKASIENAIHCWSTLLTLKVPEQDIQNRFLNLHAVSMRLELKHGINDCIFINDAYNSDLTSLSLAIQYLKQQIQYQQHTLILSEMQQISIPDAELYQEIASLLKQYKIKRLIGIGDKLIEHSRFFKEILDDNAVFFKTTDDFINEFDNLKFDNEAILLKGARKYKFEKINRLLEQKVHQTILSIDLAAITNNYKYFRRQVPAPVKIMVMVKAYSYGSGSYEIANTLQQLGVDYLGVAYTDEAVSLRKAGITLPIMVMNPDIDSFNKMIAWNLEPELYNTSSVKKFSIVAASLKKYDYPVHIKLDTGMNRLGFKTNEVDALLDLLENNTYLKIASIFSHLSASDDPKHDSFTKKQGEVFEATSSHIMQHLGITPLRHISNTSSIVRHPNLNYNMVRLGLGIYGIDGSSTINEKLQQAATLTTIITQIKTVMPGENIGYGHTTIAKDKMRIATINIGYADGYTRSLSKSDTYALVNGQKAPLVGKVCMDMCMIDITKVHDANEGDNVVLFGKELSVTQLAVWADTIPYEILTNISQRVKRVYENEV